MKEKEWTWETVPDAVLFPYSAMDAYYTAEVLKKQLTHAKALPPEQKTILSYYQKVLVPTAIMCARYEHRGLQIDRDWIGKVQEEFETEMEGNLVKMKRYATEKEFNPGSSQQVGKVLKGLGIDTGVLTEKGEMSVKSEAIEPIIKKHAFLKYYAAWKEKQALVVNFLKKFDEMADLTGFLYPSYNPAFQVTTRISVSKPPVANTPRDKRVRGSVISRFKDGSLLGLDYKQLEMRLVASEADDAAMLAIFKSGLDVHDETAKIMFGKSFTEGDRSISKNINFGTVYGISSWSLTRKFNIPERKAEDFLARHKAAFPAIYKWMDAQHAFIRKNGWIASRLGQVRHFPGWKDATDRERFRMMRQAGNFPIQELGAGLTNLAAKTVDDLLRASYHSFVDFQQHDSIKVDLNPKDNSEEIKEHCERIMSVKVPKLFAPFLKVELPVSSQISRRWGGAE